VFAQIAQIRCSIPGDDDDDPVKVATFLGGLDVAKVNDNIESVTLFWSARAASVVNRLPPDESLPLLISMIDVAVELSERLERNIPIVAVLDGLFEGDVPDRPSSWPSRPIDRSGFDSLQERIKEYIKNTNSFTFPTAKYILDKALLFSAIRFQFTNENRVHERNPGYLFEREGDALPDMPYEEVAQFSVARSLFEALLKVKVPRLFPTDEIVVELFHPDKYKTMPLSAFVYVSFRPIPFNPSFDITFIFLALLNSAICDQRVPVKPTASMILASRFLPSLAVDNSFLASAFRVSLDLIVDLLGSQYLTVAQSAHNSESASIQLLSIPECLPLLSDGFPHHRLLKIFAGSHDDKVVVDSLDFSFTLESTAEFISRKRLPEDRSVCESMLSSLYTRLCTLTWDREKERYPCAFLGITKVKTRVLVDPKDFFGSSYSDLDFLNTLFFITITHFAALHFPLEMALASDLAMHSYIAQAVRDLLPPPLPPRRIFWEIHASAHSLSLDLPGEHVVSIYSHFLTICDFSTLSRLRGSIPQSQIIALVTPELASATLHLSLEPIPYLVASLLAHSPTTVYEIIWRLAIVGRAPTSLAILQKAKLTAAVARQIIDAAPPEIAELPVCPPELAALASTLVAHLPRRLFAPSNPLIARAPLMFWEEDVTTVSQDIASTDEFNIWVERPVPCECVKTASGRRVGYYCYTCSRQELLCLNCATHCHRGHCVTYGRFSEFTCKCASLCTCGQQIQAVPEAPQPTANPNALMRMICAIGESKIEEEPDRLDVGKGYDDATIRSRMSGDMRTCRIGGMEQHFTPARVKLETVHTPILQTRGLSPLGFDRTIMGSLSLRFADSVQDLLFVASGDHVRSFVLETYEMMGDFKVMAPIVSIVTRKSPAREILLAVGVLRGFEVVSFQRQGTAKRLIRHRADGPPLALEWVCGHVAVLWPSAVELYAVTEQGDAAIPVQTYKADGETMTSCVFIEQDGLTFLLVAFSSGNSAIEPILLNGGPVTRLVPKSRWTSKFAGLHISSCMEANLFFLGAPGVDLQMYRRDAVFADSAGPDARLAFESANPVAFCCTVPGCPSMLIFVHWSSNALFTCEFTNTAILTSRIPSRQRCRLFDREQDMYAWAQTSDSFLVIASDGSVQKLVASAPEQADEPEDQYHVPLTFWSLAGQATTENSEITGTDPSQNYNTLYKDSPAYFHTGTLDKVLTFHLRDPSYAIVGIMLAFVHHQADSRPPYILIKNRRYNTKADRNHTFPLMPSEVRPGEKLDIRFPARAESEIAMQSAVIFIMRVDQIRPFLGLEHDVQDWLAKPKGLLDFADLIPRDARTPELVAHQLATAIFVQDEHEIDLRLVRRLIKLLYRKPHFSKAARSAIVRIATAKPEFVKAWAEGLCEVLQDREVDRSLWDCVWRDFSQFSQELQDLVQGPLWEADPPVGSLGCVLSAFSYRSE
jgi:hypothetical protein